MKREKMVIFGIGQCGCNFADEMKEKNKKYTVAYVNSSKGDLKGLNYANKDNTFLFTNVDGSGRDRDKAKSFLKTDRDGNRLIPFINSYNTFDSATVFFSTDGGTGSGCAIGFLKVLKRVLPHALINVVAVLPRIKADNLQLLNSLECCSELFTIKDEVNSIVFVDNDNGETYFDINTKVVNELDNAFSLLYSSEVGSIDEGNLTKVWKSNGYGVILNLPKEKECIEDALTEARENSMFAIPDRLDCSYGAMALVKASYHVEDLEEMLYADNTLFKSYNNKVNYIVLGGCDFPNERLQDMENEIYERESKRGKRRRGDIYTFKSNNPKEKETKSNELTFRSDDELDDLFDLDNILQ